MPANYLQTEREGSLLQKYRSPNSEGCRRSSEFGGTPGPASQRPRVRGRGAKERIVSLPHDATGSGARLGPGTYETKPVPGMRATAINGARAAG